MILIDTSVLIDFARGRDTKLAALVPLLPVVVCGVVRAEMLHGVRSATERRDVLALLNSFPPQPIPDSIWDTVGDNLHALRAGGLTLPFADAVIATVAITNDIELWTRDAHFTHVQRILPALKLFAEPP
jgi:predicted nucleic acid-binding protein